MPLNRGTILIRSGKPEPTYRRKEIETMGDYRVEHDSMGDVKVPAAAYYGAQTQRAVENFPISGRPLPAPLSWGQYLSIPGKFRDRGKYASAFRFAAT